MSIMWSGSLTPWIDPNGNPYAGAKAFFFDAGTITPRVTYTDSSQSIAHDHPVVANASGMFPPIFLQPGDYRLRLETSTGVTLVDVDGVSTPIYTPPDGGGGDTDPTLLFQTGDYIFRHGTGAKSGWVRANGRTIGNASSGATERANADCENLFLWLWSQDSTLVVTGGRGASAAGDWAAGKQISLPDARLRGFIGMASMGNTASTIIPASMFDAGEDGDILGATAGVATVTLTIAQIPSHLHGVNDPGHNHGYNDTVGAPFIPSWGGGAPLEWGNQNSAKTTGTKTTGITIQNNGGGESHSNVQPVMAATCYIKL